jgi:hypothetical protein
MPDFQERYRGYCNQCRYLCRKLLSNSFSRNPFSRTVGIELEFVVPAGTAALDLFDYGILKDDGSVRALDKQKGMATEFNSHITNGDTALDLFHQVCCKLLVTKPS